MTNHRRDTEDVDVSAVIDSLHEKRTFPAVATRRLVLGAAVLTGLTALGATALFLGSDEAPSNATSATGRCTGLQNLVTSVDLEPLRKVESPSDAPKGLRGRVSDTAEEIRAIALEGAFSEEITRAVLSAAIAYDALGAAILGDLPGPVVDAIDTVESASRAAVAACGNVRESPTPTTGA